MQTLRPPKLVTQGKNEVLRTHRDPILAAFSLAYGNLHALKIETFHPQAHLPARVHYRQPAQLLRRNDLPKPGEVDTECHFVQEKQGSLRLILRGMLKPCAPLPEGSGTIPLRPCPYRAAQRIADDWLAPASSSPGC